MYSSSARLSVKAGGLAGAIADSIAAECSEGARGAAASADSSEGTIRVDFAPQEIAHLRAGLNSALRLIQASHGALEATGAK